jgi:hypothetical protein
MIFLSSIRFTDADGAHRLDELVDTLRGEEVLLDLVGLDAVAGLVDGHLGQRAGLRRDGRRHRGHDGVDPFLRQLGKRSTSVPWRRAPACERSKWM